MMIAGSTSQQKVRVEGSIGAPVHNASAGFQHDFSQIPTYAPAQATMWSGPSNDKPRNEVIGHTYPFSASIRVANPARQSDGTSHDEPKPANHFETSATRMAITAGGSTPPSREGGTFHYPDSELPAIALPGQSDSIVSTLDYASSINRHDPPPDPGDFGTTRPFYTITDRAATQGNGVFTVTGKVNATITFQVSGGTRTNIASDSDAAITQANYPKVVSDLTPATAAVNGGGLTLMKNQPPRTQFWAEDLTVKHECFHAVEDVNFGQTGAGVAQTWLNGQTAANYDQVGALFPTALQKVVNHVTTAMAPPGREERAYADGADSYRARAQAIKQKGDARGYVPPPPAPAPSPSPAPISAPTRAPGK
jgi:hypothetical protein